MSLFKIVSYRYYTLMSYYNYDVATYCYNTVLKESYGWRKQIKDSYPISKKS